MGRIVNISGTEIKDHGILVLTDYVKKNLPDEYTLVLGCKPDTSDVDAVLIGRGSTIFSIEAKDWEGNIRARSYGPWEKDGTPIDNPLPQARDNAVALAKWLSNRIGQDRVSEALGSPGKLSVRSLLVFTNPECSIDATGIDRASNTGVMAIRLEVLKDALMQQKGDERIGQMVEEMSGRLDVDIRRSLRKTKCIVAITVLGFIFFGISICGAYLTWSKDPDKTIAFVPLGFLILLGIGSLVMIKLLHPMPSRRMHFPERKRCDFPTSRHTLNLSDYGQANAVLTNYIIDGH